MSPTTKTRRGRPLVAGEKLVTIGISLTPEQIRRIDDVVSHMQSPSASRSLMVRLLIDQAFARAKGRARK